MHSVDKMSFQSLLKQAQIFVLLMLIPNLRENIYFSKDNAKLTLKVYYLMMAKVKKEFDF